jgi:hypothetical protein
MGFIQSAVSKPLSIHCHCYVSGFRDWFKLEDMVSPEGMSVEPLGGGVITNSVGLPHPAGVKPPGPTGESSHGMIITLTVVAGVVHHHQARGFPGPLHVKAITHHCSYSFPGWAVLRSCQFPSAAGSLTSNKTIIEGGDRCVQRFDWTPLVDRDTDSLAFAALVEETQPRVGSNHGSSPWISGSNVGARLIVVPEAGRDPGSRAQPGGAGEQGVP